MGVGGGVRQVKLYSYLACAQKRQKCQFVPNLWFTEAYIFSSVFPNANEWSDIVLSHTRARGILKDKHG